MNVISERPKWSVVRNCQRCNSKLEIMAEDLTVTPANNERGYLICFVCPVCSDSQHPENVYLSEIPKEQRPVIV